MRDGLALLGLAACITCCAGAPDRGASLGDSPRTTGWAETSHLPPAPLPRLEQARRYWQRGQIEEIASLAWDARGTADDVAELRAMGAVGALAGDCADQAIELVGGSREPELLRVVMRAHLLRDRWQEAAEVASALELAGDDEARSVARVGAEARDRELWVVDAQGCLEGRVVDAPVGVTTVAIDGVPALALIDTTSHITQVSTTIRADDGVLDTLSLGATIRGVPYFSRDLSRQSELAGMEIRVVLGRDILFRWMVAFESSSVRLGGPRRQERVRMFQVYAVTGMHQDAPTVALLQCEPASPGATTCQWSIDVAFDTTSPHPYSIEEAALALLPLGYAEAPGESRYVRILGLRFLALDRDTPFLVQQSGDHISEAPPRATMGWRALGGSQLGWGSIERSLLPPPPASSCRQGVVDGPRTTARCALESYGRREGD